MRDFSQYVNWVTSQNCRRATHPCGKWTRQPGISAASRHGAEIEYEILADQSGPFGAQLNSQHAFFNLAEILMYPVDARTSPVEISFTDLPAGWHIATRSRSSGDGFSAPRLRPHGGFSGRIGAFQESDFDQGGGHYRVVVDADPSDYDMHKIVAMLRSLVSSATAWMDDRPFQTYLFFYHFPRGPAGGGMEHAYSTAIDISANAWPRTRYRWAT